MSSSNPHIYAAIDVGTNSVKIIIVNLSSNSANLLYEQTIISRLGEGMTKSEPLLQETAMKRTLDSLRELVAAARSYGAVRIVSVGTAALREAQNRDQFLKMVNEILNVNIEVVSGDEEARLSYLAVRRDPLWRDAYPLLVVDIGGGSTEVIRGGIKADKPDSRISVPLGAVRLTEKYFTLDPTTSEQLEEAEHAIHSAFASLPAGGDGVLVGVGGTISNLAAMDSNGDYDPERLHGHILTRETIKHQIQILKNSTISERKKIAGLDPKRADIILGGALLLKHTLMHLGAASVASSMRGLRWGLLYDRFLTAAQE